MSRKSNISLSNRTLFYPSRKDSLQLPEESQNSNVVKRDLFKQETANSRFPSLKYSRVRVRSQTFEDVGQPNKSNVTEVASRLTGTSFRPVTAPLSKEKVSSIQLKSNQHSLSYLRRVFSREISVQWLEKLGFTFSPFAFIFGTTFLFAALASTLQKQDGQNVVPVTRFATSKHLVPKGPNRSSCLAPTGLSKNSTEGLAQRSCAVAQWLQTLSHTKLPGLTENKVSQMSSWVFLQSILSQYINRDNSLVVSPRPLWGQPERSSGNSVLQDPPYSAQLRQGVPRPLTFARAKPALGCSATNRNVVPAGAVELGGAFEIQLSPIWSQHIKKDFLGVFIGATRPPSSARPYHRTDRAIGRFDEGSAPLGSARPTERGLNKNKAGRFGNSEVAKRVTGTTFRQSPEGQVREPRVRLGQNYVPVTRFAPSSPLLGQPERSSGNLRRAVVKPARAASDQSSIRAPELEKTLIWPWYQIMAYHPPNRLILPTWTDYTRTEAKGRNVVPVTRFATSDLTGRAVNKPTVLPIKDRLLGQDPTGPSTSIAQRAHGSASAPRSATNRSEIGSVQASNSADSPVGRVRPLWPARRGLVWRVAPSAEPKCANPALGCSATNRNVVPAGALLHSEAVQLPKRKSSARSVDRNVLPVGPEGASNNLGGKPPRIWAGPYGAKPSETSVERLRLEDDSIPSKKDSIYSKKNIDQDTLSARVLYVVKKSFYDYGLSIEVASRLTGTSFRPGAGKPPIWVAAQHPEDIGQLVAGTPFRPFGKGSVNQELLLARSQNKSEAFDNPTQLSCQAKSNLAGVLSSADQTEALRETANLSEVGRGRDRVSGSSQNSSKPRLLSSTKYGELRSREASNRNYVPALIFRNIAIPKKSFWGKAHSISGYNFPELQDYEVADLFEKVTASTQSKGGLVTLLNEAGRRRGKFCKADKFAPTPPANSWFCRDTNEVASRLSGTSFRQVFLTPYLAKIPPKALLTVTDSNKMKDLSRPRRFHNTAPSVLGAFGANRNVVPAKADQSSVFWLQSNPRCCASAPRSATTFGPYGDQKDFNRRYTPLELEQESNGLAPQPNTLVTGQAKAGKADALVAEQPKVKKAFKKLGRDYLDYLKQPKDSLPALLLSPSLEDDKEIEEEEVQRLAQEKAAAKAAAKRTQNEEEYSISDSEANEEEFNIIDLDPSGQTELRSAIELALREGKSNASNLEDEPVNDEEIEDSRFERLRFTREVETKKAEEDCRGLALSLPCRDSTAPMVSLEVAKRLQSLRFDKLALELPRVSSRKHSFFGQRSFWPTRLFSQEERLVSAHIINPYILYDQSNPWLITEQDGGLPVTSEVAKRVTGTTFRQTKRIDNCSASLVATRTLKSRSDYPERSSGNHPKGEFAKPADGAVLHSEAVQLPKGSRRVAPRTTLLVPTGPIGSRRYAPNQNPTGWPVRDNLVPKGPNGSRSDQLVAERGALARTRAKPATGDRLLLSGDAAKYGVLSEADQVKGEPCQTDDLQNLKNLQIQARLGLVRFIHLPVVEAASVSGQSRALVPELRSGWPQRGLSDANPDSRANRAGGRLLLSGDAAKYGVLSEAEQAKGEARTLIPGFADPGVANSSEALVQRSCAVTQSRPPARLAASQLRQLVTGKAGRNEVPVSRRNVVPVTPKGSEATSNHNRIYKPDPRLRLTPLEPSISADWRDDRKVEATPFRVTSKERPHLVLPELSENEWQKSIEWQLKSHFLDEDTRLKPLVATEPYKTFKVKRIERSVPWLTLAKSSFKLFQWPYKTVGVFSSLGPSGFRATTYGVANAGTTFRLAPKGPKSTSGRPEPAVGTVCFGTVFRHVQLTEDLNSWSTIDRPVIRRPKELPVTFLEEGSPTFTPFRLLNYSKIPLASSFTTYSKNRSALSVDSSQLFDVTKKLFSSQDDLNTELLFEPPSTSSWFLIYRLFLALILKEVFKYIYRISLKDFFIRIINSDFGRTITSPEFRQSVQFEPFPEFYKPKNRLKDLIGIKNALLPLSEIIWFLRNNCRSRSGPHGVVLLGPEGVDTTAIAQAVAGEAKVPIIVQSLRALTLTHSHPQKRLEKVLLLARAKAPCVLFLDELDVIGQSREGVIRNTSGDGNSLISLGLGPTRPPSSARPVGSFRLQGNLKDSSQLADGPPQLQSPDDQATSQGRRVDLMLRLLTVMDGLHHLNGVVIITTSKNTATLDPALLRPGRFDRLIHLTLPNHEDRMELLTGLLRNPFGGLPATVVPTGRAELGGYVAPRPQDGASDPRSAATFGPFGTAQVNPRERGQTEQMPLTEQSSWLSEAKLEYLSLRTANMGGADILSAINYSALRAIVNDTVHTIETLEYGLNCVKALKAKQGQARYAGTTFR